MVRTPEFSPKQIQLAGVRGRHVVSDFAWGGQMYPPPRHVLAISNGIVNFPEYILTNSHFLLENNEIVIEY